MHSPQGLILGRPQARCLSREASPCVGAGGIWGHSLSLPGLAQGCLQGPGIFSPLLWIVTGAPVGGNQRRLADNRRRQWRLVAVSIDLVMCDAGIPPPPLRTALLWRLGSLQLSAPQFRPCASARTSPRPSKTSSGSGWAPRH